MARNEHDTTRHGTTPHDTPRAPNQVRGDANLVLSSLHLFAVEPASAAAPAGGLHVSVRQGSLQLLEGVFGGAGGDALAKRTRLDVTLEGLRTMAAPGAPADARRRAPYHSTILLLYYYTLLLYYYTNTYTNILIYYDSLLLDYSTTRLLDYSTTRLLDYSTTLQLYY